MEKSAPEIIAALIKENPQAVSQLYRDHGVMYKVPDVQTTLDLIAVYGEPFLMQLYNLHSDSFLGIGLLVNNVQARRAEKASETPADKKEKGAGWAKFKNVFSNSVSSVKNLIQPGANNNPATPEVPSSAGTPADKKIMGLSLPLFIGLCVVVLIIIIALIAKLSSSK